MIDMNTVTDEQADYMNTPTEAFEETLMLQKNLAIFFPNELGDYLDTDFCERVARRMVWNIEKGFARLPERFRAVAFHHAVLTDDSDVVDAFVRAAKKAVTIRDIFGLVATDDDDDMPESVENDFYMLAEALVDYLPDELDVYQRTGFFISVCRREASKTEALFPVLPQELRTIAFHHAVLTNHADVVKAFVRAARFLKADINNDFDVFPERISPLMTACRYKRRRSFSVLVKDGGADLNACDYEGRTLAYTCVCSGDVAFMRWAQKQGVVFDANNPVDALVPLAAEQNDQPSLKWLIDDLGGDADAVGEYGETALDHACMSENADMFLYLSEKGAKKLTGVRENLFGLVFEQIETLRQHPQSDKTKEEIARYINTLRCMMVAPKKRSRQ